MFLDEQVKTAAELKTALTSLGVTPRLTTNFRCFATLLLPATTEGMDQFNSIVSLLQSYKYDDSLVFTPSGGFCTASNSCGFGFKIKKSCFELVGFLPCGGFRVLFNGMTTSIKQGGLTGGQAYRILREEFKKDGIDLAEYATDDGEEVKATIEKPLISTTTYVKCGEEHVYDHVHHLDLHSAYPSGLAFYHPELKGTVERIYNKRKDTQNGGKRLKLALDASIGYFQSEYCIIDHHKYALSVLARDAIQWCRDTILELTTLLLEAGYVPLAYNTDGIWYRKRSGGSSEPFHCKLEGSTLGTYANDHINCRIRWKSKGSYEYIEDGVYHPVQRGHTTLDSFKPRENWVWGDIFKGQTLRYRFNTLTWRIEQAEEDM